MEYVILILWFLCGLFIFADARKREMTQASMRWLGSCRFYRWTYSAGYLFGRPPKDRDLTTALTGGGAWRAGGD